MESLNSLKHSTVNADQMGRLIECGIAYAILDGAVAPSIARNMLARRDDNEALSLFEGTPYRDNWAVAPYLVRLDQPVFDWIGKELAGQPWGIVLCSGRSHRELFLHFRRLITLDLPDGRPSVFRFYDPRVLPAFLGSREAKDCGIWNGISALGWEDGAAITMAKPPADGPADRATSTSAKVLVSPELAKTLALGQATDFTKRCRAYLEKLGVPLPDDPGAFIESVLKSAKSRGIAAEVDVVRFAHLLLGWKEMKSIPAAREVLTYPELAGSDRVDLLCEMAAFSVPRPKPPESFGLDVDAMEQATAQFLAQHEKDKRFQRMHPDGVLTMGRSDTRWRKQWIRLYTQQVATRAKVTDVEVGSTAIS
jgi:hypothetical protein